MATDTGTERGNGGLSVSVTLVAGAIAALVLTPALWLLFGAFEARGSLGLLLADTTVEVFVNSVLLAVGVTVASIAIAVPLAYLTVRTDLPGKRLFTVLLSMPLVVPSYIGAFAFVWLFGPGGWVSDVLGTVGLDSPSIYGLWGSVLVLTLYTYPYVFITTRAALKTMDTALVDAARTLRHTRWEAFKRVTFPQIRPAIAAGSLLVSLYALSDFGTPQIMRYDVFTRVIYSARAYDFDLALLLSLQLVVVTLFILAVEARVRGSGVRSEHPGRQPTPVRLGRWTLPAMAACLLVPLVALAVPLGVLSHWLTAGTASYSLTFQPRYGAASAVLSLGAAVVAALCALPLAYVGARRRGLLAAVIERASYVGYAVPGVVIGLAFVFFGARYIGEGYSSVAVAIPLLVFAYVVRFLPQAVGSTRTSFERISPTLGEAARTLGESPGGAFRRVTLPLVAPGLLGGAALVFLTTMKELPATLLLLPGSHTLVTYLWTAERAGYYGQAALPAFALLAVSACSLLVMLKLEGYDVE
ncbi:ABC transporter permease [Halomarina ordinaria]|uniref:ABC transporter permease n=1 Tax=Halomarina ordinaria TaxID=3033939 RepID=A0ABD5UCD3_9EURY|nr:iron ABC transporter permease [Halomarina sp. PSRA2]